MKYYLYNPLANKGIKPAFLDNIEEGNDIEIKEVIDLDYPQFIASLKDDDELVLIGGDGTINFFINEIKDVDLKCKVYLKAIGTSNDFLTDIEKDVKEEVLINEYLNNLPTVYVKELERRFINGVGFGIDGYCKQKEADIKKETEKDVNYSSVIMKSFLFQFKPRKATIIVDGNEYHHEHVWVASTLKGRYYAGGVKAAPNQNRINDEVSVVVYHSKSRIKALSAVPSIFKGEHLKKEKMITIYRGRDIVVKFDKPSILLIDGERVVDVLEYQVRA